MRELSNIKQSEYTSLKMAEITGKRHDNIMRDIKDEISQLGEEKALLIFEESIYTNSNNRSMPMFSMTEEGWLQMGARYDAKTRYTIISYNKKLKEKFTVPNSLSEALRLAANQAEKIEQQQAQLKEMEPKAIFSDAVSSSSDLILIRELAKLASTNKFTIGQNKLYKWMKIEGYLMVNNEPYQRFVNQGLFKVVERTGWNGEEMKTSRTTKITGKGQTYFIDKIHKYFNVETELKFA